MLVAVCLFALIVMAWSGLFATFYGYSSVREGRREKQVLADEGGVDAPTQPPGIAMLAAAILSSISVIFFLALAVAPPTQWLFLAQLRMYPAPFDWNMLYLGGVAVSGFFATASWWRYLIGWRRNAKIPRQPSSPGERLWLAFFAFSWCGYVIVGALVFRGEGQLLMP